MKPMGGFTIFFMLLMVPIITGCEFFTISPLEVISWKPSEEVVSLEDLSVVEVVFSAPVNKPLTETAFSFTGNGDPIEGRIEWPAENTLRFIPYEPPSEHGEYTIVVDTTAEDTHGNSLREDFSYTFYTSTDRTRPRLLSTYPEDGSAIDTIRPTIRFTFSEAVNLPSVIEGVEFSPSIKGYFQSDATGTEIMFFPTEDLMWQTYYTITLKEDIKDLFGNTLGREETLVFYTGTDTTPPEEPSFENSDGTTALVFDDPEDNEQTVTHEWEKEWNIYIRFNEPVDRNSIETRLHISPRIDLSYTWEDDTCLVLTHEEALEPETLYEITLEEGWKDLQGNAFLQPLRRYLMTDGPGSRRPKVLGIYFLNSFEGTTPTGMEHILPLGSFSYHDVYADPLYDKKSVLDVYFELSEGAHIDPFMFIDNFFLSAEEISITPQAIQIDENISHLAAELPPENYENYGTDPRVHVVRVILNVDNQESTPAGGEFKITIAGDFEDSLGNAMGEDWELITYTTN
ncbi:Ig-like domain-containing protein [Spirochaeta thermophila]|uniref:SbsA Ig-like domain-containing protein n=1 Tax=Winmispira thermophila (strain ATCC 49972 / DSM 6192 / RI 19.B1) TaxID=665571 RepID=E0RQI6_WINT6|nr:Ig-like domain-containing protein [Spirochaeta thermophila]ADN02962.1 hypothetical protein STHERM_c20270 [Spirochaeta thermophila DSM 6192]